jgi:hypothetical protein
MAAYCEIDMEHKNTLCGQNAKILSAEDGH